MYFGQSINGDNSYTNLWYHNNAILLYGRQLKIYISTECTSFLIVLSHKTFSIVIIFSMKDVVNIYKWRQTELQLYHKKSFGIHFGKILSLVSKSYVFVVEKPSIPPIFCILFSYIVLKFLLIFFNSYYLGVYR
jgi:hypothetical protein